MDKIFNIAQLIIVAVIFLCCLAGVIGHIVLGHITSFFGYLVCLLFLYLSWVMVRIVFKEYRKSKH